MTASTSSDRPGTDLDVFTFLDYRAFLRAFYEARKKREGLSFRVFSRRAGLTSPNYLKLVIEGQRNLSGAMSVRFARACGLSGAREQYFTRLVAFNQAQTTEERNHLYAGLRRRRGAKDARRLSRAQDIYHSRWYLPAIREFTTSAEFREDPQWIARRMWPTISKRQATEALELLTSLGLLTRGDDGRLRQADATVSTGPELRSLHLAMFHRTMIEHGKAAIDFAPASDRDISALTLCLGPSGLSRVKQAIQRFRRELLDLAELDTDPRQVVQVNFQLFPLTRLGPAKKRRRVK